MTLFVTSNDNNTINLRDIRYVILKLILVNWTSYYNVRHCSGSLYILKVFIWY